MKRILILTALFMMVFTLSSCKLYNLDSKDDVLEYALVATDESDLDILEQYPNLAYVDLRGSTCYAAIADYAAAHPNVKIRFAMDLGQKSYDLDITELTVSGSDVVFEDMLKNLEYFRLLEKIHIEQISITKVQLEELKAAYPHIDFTYTVKLGNEVYDTGITRINLSKINPAEVKIAIAALGHFPNLTHIDLVDASGDSNLSVSDCRAIIEAYPNINYTYQFKLFGKTLSQKTESITYLNTKIGNDGLDQIRDALTLMPNCTYLCLDNCSIDNEVINKLRQDFPNVTVVWRVYVGQYSVMTDSEVVLMRHTVDDDEAEPLKYCTNVKYLDMTGCKIRDFSFLANMPMLECAVLAQTQIADISPLRNSSKLVWLDLSNCTAVSEISPLSDLRNLKYLNLSATKVEDLTPLNDVALERFKCVKTAFGAVERDRFKSRHPNCLTTNTGSVAGKGWRFDDTAQRVPCEYYATMIKAFGYSK